MRCNGPEKAGSIEKQQVNRYCRSEVPVEHLLRGDEVVDGAEPEVEGRSRNEHEPGEDGYGQVHELDRGAYENSESVWLLVEGGEAGNEVVDGVIERAEGEKQSDYKSVQEPQ